MTRILSLDNDPAILELLGLILELAGFDHLVTTDNEEALSLLRAQPPDLFTQDVARPVMDGLEFYLRMKSDETLRHIPVLFITGGMRPTFAASCRAIYGDDYLTKPFELREIVMTVAGLLRRRGKHVPTREERAARYERVRERWQTITQNRFSEQRFSESYELINQWSQDTSGDN